MIAARGRVSFRCNLHLKQVSVEPLNTGAGSRRARTATTMPLLLVTTASASNDSSITCDDSKDSTA